MSIFVSIGPLGTSLIVLSNETFQDTDRSGTIGFNEFAGKRSTCVSSDFIVEHYIIVVDILPYVSFPSALHLRL